MFTIYQYEDQADERLSALNGLEQMRVLFPGTEVKVIRKMGDDWVTFPIGRPVDEQDVKASKIVARALFHAATFMSTYFIPRIERSLNDVVPEDKFFDYVKLKSLFAYTERKKSRSLELERCKLSPALIRKHLIPFLLDHPEVTRVSLKCNKWDKRSWTEFGTFFKANKSVTHLEVVGHGRDMDPLFDSLKDDRCIQALSLRSDDDIHNFWLLLRFINKSRTLTSFNLSCTYNEDVFNSIFFDDLLRKKLTSLKACDSQGLRRLREALSKCPTLTDLQISTYLMQTDIASIMKENTNIVRWNLSRPRPPDDNSLSPIFNALANTNHITHLNLSACATFETMDVLAKALQHNRSITDLDLSDNRIHMDSMNILWEGILANGRVVKLNLSRSVPRAFIATSFIPLCNLLKNNRSITSLNLAHNYMNIHVDLICDALKQNGSLKELDLSNSDLAEKGGLAVTNYLQENRVLTSLNYSHNPVNSAVIKAFARAIKVNRSLKTLALRGRTAHATDYLEIAEASKFNSTLTSIDLSHKWQGPMSDRVKLSMHFLNHQKEIDDQKLTFLMASDERQGSRSAAHTHFFAHMYFDRTTVLNIFDFIGGATYIKM